MRARVLNIARLHSEYYYSIASCPARTIFSFTTLDSNLCVAMKIFLLQHLAVATLLSLLANDSVAAKVCPVMMISDMELSESQSPTHEQEDDGECMTLQQVLNRVSLGSGPVNCTAVYVHRGDHYLTSPVNFIANSVHIVGVGNNISIICNYSKVHETRGSEYMWLFQNNRNVIIRNLNFYACPYPFRILYAKDVYVADSSFRYVLSIIQCISSIIQLQNGHYDSKE